jgi:hypothetical protein
MLTDWKLNHGPVSKLIDEYMVTKGRGSAGVYKTVTGNPISVTDALAAKIKSLTVDMSPIQDLHGYDSPWPAGGGKNLFNYDAWKNIIGQRATLVFENNGVTITALENDAYTHNSLNVYPEGAKVPVSEGETITLAWEADSDTDGMNYIFPNGKTDGLKLGNNKNTKSVSYTATAGITFVTIRFGVTNAGDTIRYKNIQVVKGTTVPAWSPYSNICPITGHESVTVWREATYDISADPALIIPLGQTVYGGTIDVTTGTVTVDRAMVDLGTLTWAVANATANIFQTDSLTDMQIPSVRNAEGIICSALKISATTSLNTDMDDYAMLRATNLARLYVRDTSYSDAASFKAAMNSVQLCYELAEPLTVQLTPQTLALLKGSNTLWTDGDSITLTYKAEST